MFFKEVNALTDGGLAEIFEVNDRQAFFQLPSGVAIRIPYPTRYLALGSHEFRISVELANGSQLEASAFYNVRPVFETAGQYPNSLPDSKLYCDPVEAMVVTNQYFWFYGRGGNGCIPGQRPEAKRRRRIGGSFRFLTAHQEPAM
ncbi:MAG: hypothetical protein HYZ51_04740 [Candidatus Doudnabacteria bacterium]|nr:hypothetical protein [Candidatus Doudnabacteria bacterium]